MTFLQKINVLKSAKKDFETRLKEISNLRLSLSNEDKLQLLNRQDSLGQAIHICNYLIMILTRQQEFRPENKMMLSFIGLDELYN